MTKIELLKEIDALATLLAYAKSSVEGDYFPAAEAYLDDIEGEATRLALACGKLGEIANQPPIAANFLHPNDPAFVPHHE